MLIITFLARGFFCCCCCKITWLALFFSAGQEVFSSVDVPCDGAAFPAPLHSLNPSECSVTVARLQGEPTRFTIMKTQHAATLTELIDVLVTWVTLGEATDGRHRLCLWSPFVLFSSPVLPVSHSLMLAGLVQTNAMPQHFLSIKIR